MSKDEEKPERRVAVVTGASRGIGRAIALKLASLEIAVVVNYQSNHEEAKATVEEIIAQGGHALSICADVRDEDAVRAMMATTLRSLGRLDILVCNAGTVEESLTATMPTKTWDAVVDTSLKGTFLCVREAAPFLMRSGDGCIVTVSSIQASSGGRGQGNYVAAKAGIEALTRSLAIEFGPKGLRVNGVAPGIIETEMTTPIREQLGAELLKEVPLRRFGQTSEVASVVAFLTSPDASYLTGAIIPLTGGYGL